MDASTTSPVTTPLLQLRGIDKRFVQPVDLAGKIANLLGAKNAPAVVHAVAGVDLEIRAGEVIGVVGESGCGKSTLGRVIAGINPPTAGEVRYKGKLAQEMTAAERKAYGLAVQMIFQNPMTAFSPIHTLGRQLTDLLWRDKHQSKADKRQRIVAALREVGIADPAGKLDAGESTRDCAQRELFEETGYRANEWARAGVLHNAIAYSSERIEIWFARGLVPGPRRLDEGEFLDIQLCSIDELDRRCAAGEVTDAKTLIGLQWLQNWRAGRWDIPGFMPG